MENGETRGILLTVLQSRAIFLGIFDKTKAAQVLLCHLLVIARKERSE